MADAIQNKTKRCNHCKEVKPIECFVKNKIRKDGYHDECKACQKEWRAKNKEKAAKKWKIYYKKNKEKINENKKNTPRQIKKKQQRKENPIERNIKKKYQNIIKIIE